MYAPVAQVMFLTQASKMMLLPLIAMMRCIPLHVPQAHIMREVHIICKETIMFRTAECITEKRDCKERPYRETSIHNGFQKVVK